MLAESQANTYVGIQIWPESIQHQPASQHTEARMKMQTHRKWGEREAQVRKHTAKATKPVANNSRYHRTEPPCTLPVNK